MKKTLEYTVIVEKQEGAKGYWVKVPALPGCYSTGDTVEKSLLNVKDAIETYIAALRERGEDIPQDKAGVVISRVKVAS